MIKREFFCNRCRQWKPKGVSVRFKNKFGIVRQYEVCPDCIDDLAHELIPYLENHHRFQTWTPDRIDGGTPINDKPWTPDPDCCVKCGRTAKQIGPNPWRLSFTTYRLYGEGEIRVRFCEDCCINLAYAWAPEQESR